MALPPTPREIHDPDCPPLERARQQWLEYRSNGSFSPGPDVEQVWVRLVGGTSVRRTGGFGWGAGGAQVASAGYAASHPPHAPLLLEEVPGEVTMTTVDVRGLTILKVTVAEGGEAIVQWEQ